MIAMFETLFFFKVQRFERLLKNTLRASRDYFAVKPVLFSVFNVD